MSRLRKTSAMRAILPFFLPRPAAARIVLTGCLALTGLDFQKDASLHAADSSEVEARAGSLPLSPELKRWFDFSREVERGLRTGDKDFSLELKKSAEGTSAYVKVQYKGEVVGAFLSENSSTSVQGEISTFNIARALGCEALFQPGIAMELRGKGLATFKVLLEAAVFSAQKEENRKNVLREMEWDPEVLHGVFKQWLPLKPIEYQSIELPDVPPNGVLNEADPVAPFLHADAPQPALAELTLPGTDGAHAPARELARELSDILLVDALAGQWDRFSGRNLHVYVEKNVARFAALDNGGAKLGGDREYLHFFEKWVTRFDRPVVSRLYDLDAFFMHPNDREFLGFRSEQALADALGIESGWPDFVSRVHEVATHVRRVERNAGAFFAED